MTARRRPRIARPSAGLVPVAVAVAAGLGPLVLGVVVALTSPGEFARSGLGLPDRLTLENVGRVLADPAALAVPMLRTAAVCILVASCQVAAALPAAYVFARSRSRLVGALFWLCIGGYLVPPVVAYLPLYLGFVQVGLAGTFWALVLPSALASPYAIFLLRQWLRAIPAELREAAELDGAGDLAILRTIVAPLARPAIATALLVSAVTAWNAYLWPRLIAGVTQPQVQVAIGALQSRYDSNWTEVMAAVMLALLPPVLLAAVLHRPLLRALEPLPETA